MTQWATMAQQSSNSSKANHSNAITVRIVIVALAVMLVLMIIRQISLFYVTDLKTERAVLYTIDKDVPFVGVFVRDERVLTYSGSGVFSYLYPDGSKIAKNAVIAEVYDSIEQIEAKAEIERLEQEIISLERAQNKGTTDFVQPDFITNQIDEQYKVITDLIEHNSFDELESARNDMLVLMNIYNITTGSESDYDGRIAQLKTQIANLKILQSEPKAMITSDESGYFVGYCDGYEGQLNYQTIDSLTVEDIEDIINNKKQVPSNYIGKMFDDYSWKMIGVVELSNRFLIGEKLNLRLESSDEIYEVLVEDVKKIDDESDKCIIILSCDQLTENLVEARISDCELVFDEYTGIKVPREAICFNSEGVKGVYVLLGENPQFKKLDIIYEAEDFVISKNSSNSEYVLLYDQILLEGNPEDESSSSE